MFVPARSRCEQMQCAIFFGFVGERPSLDARRSTTIVVRSSIITKQSHLAPEAKPQEFNHRAALELESELEVRSGLIDLPPLTSNCQPGCHPDSLHLVVSAIITSMRR